MHDLAGQRVTVMGLGRFGGGTGVTRWLSDQGADVLVTDLASRDQLADSVKAISDLIDHGHVKLRLGEHNVSDFTKADLVIANPAVPQPWNDRFLRSAMAAGVPVTTEIRLLVERLDRSKVIGITGSAGKSTTSAMIHHILVRAGINARFGGNIGGSLLGSLGESVTAEWIVLELSSAMLHWLGEGVGFENAVGFSPAVAVLTNIAPNHIDWHGSFEHYQNSKLNIFRFQQPGEPSLRGEQVVAPSSRIELAIPGGHNQINARLAAAAVRAATGLSFDDCTSRLIDFRGLPHRLQLVLERDGLKFYNDSKSTTPEATLLAVEAFEDARSVHLVAGGYDKGSDLTSIAALAPRLGGLYTIGKTGPTLAMGGGEYCQTLERAVASALNRMNPGDVLLLSPGCASWDQFTNYEARGDAFCTLVSGSIPAAHRH